MTKPIASVIIPVYNAQKTLKDCLESVLAQDFNDFEVIVIDNNSTDLSQKIIKEFERQNKRIKYIFEQKKGRGAARNAGLEIAAGEVIAMIDSDCIAPPDWLKEITKLIINGYENIVMGFEKDIINNFWTKNIQKANWNYICKYKRNNYASHLDTKNFAIKASIINQYKFDSNLGNMEDFDLYLRIKDNYKIRFVPSITINHYHKNSFISVIKINIDRGFWTYKIYRKHKSKKNILQNPMFESILIVNNILFPFWLVFQFFKKPIGQAFYITVAETSWRLGLLRAIIKK